MPSSKPESKNNWLDRSQIAFVVSHRPGRRLFLPLLSGSNLLHKKWAARTLHFKRGFAPLEKLLLLPFIKGKNIGGSAERRVKRIGLYPQELTHCLLCVKL
jgi:hypothetical protein